MRHATPLSNCKDPPPTHSPYIPHHARLQTDSRQGFKNFQKSTPTSTMCNSRSKRCTHQEASKPISRLYLERTFQNVVVLHQSTDLIPQWFSTGPGPPIMVSICKNHILKSHLRWTSKSN